MRILLRQMFLTIQDSFTSKLENILAKAWKGRFACEQFEAFVSKDSSSGPRLTEDHLSTKHLQSCPEEERVCKSDIQN